MTLQQIRYLEAVVETGSISKAAELLYAAQSSISAAIKEVEKEYNITIFERTSKGVLLTHQGREFWADIRYISTYHQHVEAKYKHSMRQEKHFSVSTLHHVCGDGAFMDLIHSIDSQSYRLGYLEGSATFVFENVESGKSDVGILFFTESAKSAFVQDIRKRGFIFNHISYGHMHIYVHKTHPLANQKEVLLAEMIPYPFVTYDNHDPDAGKYTISFQQWERNHHLFHVSDRATAYSILRQGRAYATGSGYLSADEQYNDIVSVPVADLEKIEVGWIVKSRNAMSEVAIEYIARIKKLYCNS